MKKLTLNFSKRGLEITDDDDLSLKEVCSDDNKIRKVAKRVFGSKRFV